MATHSSIFAWRVPWTEEPAGLQSMGREESDTTERLTQVCGLGRQLSRVMSVQVGPICDFSSSDWGWEGRALLWPVYGGKRTSGAVRCPRKPGLGPGRLSLPPQSPGVRWLTQCPTWAEKNCKVMLQSQCPRQSGVFSPILL